MTDRFPSSAQAYAAATTASRGASATAAARSANAGAQWIATGTTVDPVAPSIFSG